MCLHCDVTMQAREVGQICTQNINKSIRLFYYCNPTFFATKTTTLSSECPLQEGPNNFSRRQSQTSASYVHNLLLFLVPHTHISVFLPSLLPLRFPGCYEHPSLCGRPFLTGEICMKSEIKS